MGEATPKMDVAPICVTIICHHNSSTFKLIMGFVFFARFAQFGAVWRSCSGILAHF